MERKVVHLIPFTKENCLLQRSNHVRLPFKNIQTIHSHLHSELDWTKYRPPYALKRGEISVADCCVSQEPDVDKLRPFSFRIMSGTDRMTISCATRQIRDKVSIYHMWLRIVDTSKYLVDRGYSGAQL